MTTPFSRRSFLGGLAAAGAAGAVRPTVAQTTGLGAVAAANGLSFGSAVRPSSLQNIPIYASIVNRECSIITCADVHWDEISPTQGAFDTHVGDYVVQYCQAHGKPVRGHTLVWWNRMPDWFAGLSQTAAIAALQNRVTTVCSHFAGKMHSWDVVNEAIKPDDRQPGGFRNSIFLQKIGPQFLDIAFTTARQADPKAMLVYNDFSLEHDIPDHRNRRNALLAMVDGFHARRVPIDAVGIQSHLYFDDMPHFNESIFSNFLSQLASRGLKIFITELDVVDVGAASGVPTRDAQVADVYRRYLTCVLANPNVTVVETWGLFDNDSWITSGSSAAFRRPDGLPPRPLPFDVNYQPKPAYTAIANALRAASPRHP